MSFEVRPAVLQDGVAVLSLLEDVGYYPEPVSFAQTFRRTISNPHFLVRVADADGRIVGVATLALRYQLGLGGLVASFDELAVDKDAPRGVEVHNFVPNLDRHLAACDLALVQGGLTTCMELTAAGTPFLYFPLRNHFEQNYHVAHRLDDHHVSQTGRGVSLTVSVVPPTNNSAVALER